MARPVTVPKDEDALALPRLCTHPCLASGTLVLVVRLGVLIGGAALKHGVLWAGVDDCAVVFNVYAFIESGWMINGGVIVSRI